MRKVKRKTLNDLARDVHSEYIGITNRDVKNLLNTAVDYICEYISEGNSVILPRLGMFKCELIPAKKRWNVKTMSYEQMPPYYHLDFAHSKRFKDKLKKKAREEYNAANTENRINKERIKE